MKKLFYIPNTAENRDFANNQSEDLIFNNFGIKINIKLIKYEFCLELVEKEKERNFQILIRSEHAFFIKKAVESFQLLFNESKLNHKLGIINHGTREEVEKQVYFTLLGSLNLACVYSNDGILKSYGVQPEKNRKELLSGTMIPSFYEPVPIEIANIQRIILDTSRCGVLEPILYFVARDFGTCIAQIYLPGTFTWSLAYLIQCDDSGRNDRDMVKVCLVKEQETAEPIAKEESIKVEVDVEGENYVKEEEVTIEDKDGDDPGNIHKDKDSDTATISTKFADSVLQDINYPISRDLLHLLTQLKETNHSDSRIVSDFEKKIKLLLNLSKNCEPTAFPDVLGPFEIKKRYAKLCNETLTELLETRKNISKTGKFVKTIKELRRSVNFLNIDLKNRARNMQKVIEARVQKDSMGAAAEEGSTKIKKKQKQAQKEIQKQAQKQTKKDKKTLLALQLPLQTDQIWLKNARSFSNSKKRLTNEMLYNRKQRINREKRDGIVTMPLLEPYLDISWPCQESKSKSISTETENVVLKTYINHLMTREEELLTLKRFGV